MMLRSWLDVERIFRQITKNYTQIPANILRIDCFYEAVEIAFLHSEQKKPVIFLLKTWFGDWFDEKNQVILLDIDNAQLPVELFEAETKKYEKSLIRPFWSEMSYLNLEKTSSFLPKVFSNPLRMAAFHSFKGGVGRTTHLAAYLFALLEQVKKVKNKINILVIDADLEAPGLTYWQRKENPEYDISLIDFLEAYHYPPTTREAVTTFYAKALKRTQHELGFYLLPTFLNEYQLLDLNVLPEHLARSPDNIWGCTQAFAELAFALEVSVVLIDLRAGLSELASPLLFDPRLERYLITTLSEQSVKGTCMVLDALAKITPEQDEEDTQTTEEAQYLIPNVIVSMVPPDLQSSPLYEQATQQLLEAYQKNQTDDNSILPKLKIEKTLFAQELLYLSDWSDARQKLTGTSMMKQAKQWIVEIMGSLTRSPDSHHTLEEVKKLREVCQKYEYAESGQADNLLITESLRKLAKNNLDKLPKVVSIGAKGAGKTFNYLQLARFKYWKTFLQEMGFSGNENDNAFIFPVSQPTHLKEGAINIIKTTRTTFLNKFSRHPFSHQQVKDQITGKLTQNLTEIEWTTTWLDLFSEIIMGYPAQQRSINNMQTLLSIDTHLKAKNVRVIFLFDGLEEYFGNIAKDINQQRALKTLLEFPNRLHEIRQSNLGVIIFLRRDFVRHAINQNVGQFEKLYESYDLSWNFKSFIELVYWICAQASIIEADSNKIYELNTEDIKKHLEKLWGLKLGRDAANEAYTYRWIYAALTDFLGRLSARDIVRLLYFTTNNTIENKAIFEKWKASRLLPPPAIRSSVQKCSEKKVKEAESEYPKDFKNWVSTLSEIDKNNLKIPFSPQALNMEQSTVEMLQELGVIYEDKETKGDARFYIPEIFRAGLGFEQARQARPRILALKRKILEKAEAGRSD